MRIQNNITAMNTHRQYTINNENVAKNAEKLSSGYRINRAGDDAAGLAISEKMRSQIRGLNMATKNSQDAISLVQTAEGALQETQNMLQRMNELAVQAATGTNETLDRNALAKEFDQLKREINDIAEQTTFNNMKILDGSMSYEGYKRSAATAGVTVTRSSTVSPSGATAPTEKPNEVGQTLTTEQVNKLNDTKLTENQQMVIEVTPTQLTSLSLQSGEQLPSKITFTSNEKAKAGESAQDFLARATFKSDVDGWSLSYSSGGRLTLTGPSGTSLAGNQFAVSMQAGTVAEDGTFTADKTTSDKLPSDVSMTKPAETKPTDPPGPSDPGTVTGTKTDGQAATKTKTTVTLDASKLAAGDTITVGDKTYEIVDADTDSPTTENAVKVVKGSDAAGTLKNLTDAMTAAGTKPTTVTVATATNGFTVEANTAGASGTATVNATIASDTDDAKALTATTVAGTNATNGTTTLAIPADGIKAGAAVTVAGKTYELVSEKGTGAGHENEIAVTDNMTLANLATELGKLDTTNTFSAADGKLTITSADATAVTATFVPASDEKESVPDETFGGFGGDIQTLAEDDETPDDTSAAADTGDTVTVELDFVKMKDGDKFTVDLGGDNKVEFEKTADIKDRASFMEYVGKQIEAGTLPEGVTGEVKGNAIIFKNVDAATKVEAKLETDATKEDTATYATNAVRIQVGALENEQLSVSIDAMTTAGLGIDNASLMSLTPGGDDQDAAGAAITAVRAAINKVSDQRATLGAMQNRLDHKIANLKVSSENLSAAESRIRDVDMASEMTQFTKNNILSQAATAMLAQANALPQNVLSLLG